MKFKEWWKETTKDSNQWTTLERLAAKSAWEFATQQALYDAALSCSAPATGLISDVERFIEEARSYETDFECSEDHAVAVNLNIAMDALAEIVERHKPTKLFNALTKE